MTTHAGNVLKQFDPRARAYLDSAVHAAGADLAAAHERVATTLPRTAVALDVGCGAGHLVFALAPAVSRITAVDPSPAMLDTVREAAASRGIAHIELRQAAAEALPFDNNSFCVVASRFSAHHWYNVPAALAEMRRVVKPGGYLLMIDLLGHDMPLADTHLQAIELLRDPGHARDLDAPQWRAAIAAAGFALQDEQRWTIRLEFDAWVRRMRTPPESVAAIRALQRGAPREVREALGYEDDGSFSPETGLFWARAL